MRIVHLLIADDGQCHVVLEMNILVFFKNGFAVVVQFDYQVVHSLDCGDFNVVGFNITSFQVTDIRIS